MLMDHAVDQIDKFFTRGAVYNAHHPKVDHANDIFRKHENISRMGVGMKKAVIKGLSDYKCDDPVSNHLFIQSGGFQLFNLGDFNAVDQLGGQHPRCRKLPEHKRDIDKRMI